MNKMRTKKGHKKKGIQNLHFGKNTQNGEGNLKNQTWQLEYSDLKHKVNNIYYQIW